MDLQQTYINLYNVLSDCYDSKAEYAGSGLQNDAVREHLESAADIVASAIAIGASESMLVAWEKNLIAKIENEKKESGFKRSINGYPNNGYPNADLEYLKNVIISILDSSREFFTIYEKSWSALNEKLTLQKELTKNDEKNDKYPHSSKLEGAQGNHHHPHKI